MKEYQSMMKNLHEMLKFLGEGIRNINQSKVEITRLKLTSSSVYVKASQNRPANTKNRTSL